MHHWGYWKLYVGALYMLEWEPECIHDPGNAIAVYRYQKKKAYITRKDSEILSLIWYKDYIINNVMTCILKTDAHCVEQKLGPQHECAVKFRCQVKDADKVAHILNTFRCNYSVK